MLAESKSLPGIILVIKQSEPRTSNNPKLTQMGLCSSDSQREMN